MKSALHAAVALGVLVLGAAGSQAYGPSPGSAPLLATEPAFIKVHELGFEPPREYTGQDPYIRRKPIYHTDCRLGRYGHGKSKKYGWHKHSIYNEVWATTSPCPGPKPREDAPVVGPGRCAAEPTVRCLGYWSCTGRWDRLQRCCTKWQCLPVIKNPLTKEPSRPPRPRPWSQRTPWGALTR
jgi:hypothetical protein